MAKPLHLLMVLLAGFGSLSLFCRQQIKEPAVAASKHNGLALVELFTSQGCSSCPPADELARKIIDEGDEDVLVLTYHVDYWDRLGWKDPFSQHIFSQRQQQYARQLNLNGVYTPQMVVNGNTEFVGSNETKLRGALQQGRLTDSITILVTPKTKGTMKVDWQYLGPPETSLNFAVVQPSATTQVARGENSGKQLRHGNVVRTFITLPSAPSGNISINIPSELESKPILLVAFCQNKKDMAINAITSSSL